MHSWNEGGGAARGDRVAGSDVAGHPHAPSPYGPADPPVAFVEHVSLAAGARGERCAIHAAHGTVA
jgi:hypothetical protein